MDVKHNCSVIKIDKRIVINQPITIFFTMTKSIYCFLLGVSVVFSGWSISSYPSMAFTLKDGETRIIGNEKLQITFNEDIIVAANQEARLEMPAQQVVSFQFYNQLTGVNDIEADETADVDVYSLSGMAIGNFKSLSEAKAHLSTGVYIVKAGNSTYKIVVE